MKAKNKTDLLKNRNLLVLLVLLPACLILLSECVNNFETQFLKDLYREAKTIFADFQALRVPHNALRAFHYFENAHRMDDFEIAVTNII